MARKSVATFLKLKICKHFNFIQACRKFLSGKFLKINIEVIFKIQDFLKSQFFYFFFIALYISVKVSQATCYRGDYDTYDPMQHR